jgi:hypothetical protein
MGALASTMLDCVVALEQNWPYILGTIPFSSNIL